jgi:hypothetical protein
MISKKHWYAIGGFVAGTLFGSKVVGFIKKR